MAGHSQYKNIMHRKGKQDAMKAKMFAKLAREITVAAKSGQSDPEMNARLRLAIQDARAETIPKHNIERAIKPAAGADLANFEQSRYEGYAPGGVAVIVEALTDNRNRTSGVVKSVFAKYGGNLGATGAVSHMFTRVGEIAFKSVVATADQMLEAAIEGGADDVLSDAGSHLVTCSYEQLGTVAGALEDKLGAPQSVKAVWRPHLSTPVDEDAAQSIMKLIAALEDDDDVQNVFANFELSDDILKKLTTA